MPYFLRYNKITSTAPRRPIDPEKAEQRREVARIRRASRPASTPTPRKMRVNVPLLRERAVSMTMSPKSLRFLAFWTFSFPAGISEEIAYTVFNSVLTQCRKNMGLEDYLWACEHQKNGTIHYHMLCNRYLRVQSVNRATATSIAYYVERGLAAWGKSSREKFNGVDVKYIFRSNSAAKLPDKQRAALRVVGYIMKYISKDSKPSERRRWHCSRSVSSLPTRIEIEEVDVNVILRDIHSKKVRGHFRKYDYAEVWYAMLLRSPLWYEWFFGGGPPVDAAAQCQHAASTKPECVAGRLNFD